jgi:hypothetical protein
VVGGKRVAEHKSQGLQQQTGHNTCCAVVSDIPFFGDLGLHYLILYKDKQKFYDHMLITNLLIKAIGLAANDVISLLLLHSIKQNTWVNPFI